MIAAAIAEVRRDRAGRIAVAAVRLGLALMSSGIALLPWPSRANLDALHAASLIGGEVAPGTLSQRALPVRRHLPAPSPAVVAGAPAAPSTSAAGATAPRPGRSAPTGALASHPARAGHHPRTA